MSYNTGLWKTWENYWRGKVWTSDVHRGKFIATNPNLAKMFCFTLFYPSPHLHGFLVFIMIEAEFEDESPSWFPLFLSCSFCSYITIWSWRKGDASNLTALFIYSYVLLLPFFRFIFCSLFRFVMRWIHCKFDGWRYA